MTDLTAGVVEAVDAYRRRRRRCWTIEEKLSIVREAEASADPVAEVARRHGLNANHLFNWRQRYRDGTLDRRRLREQTHEAIDFFDLGVVDEGRPASCGPGVIEIELADRARIRVGPQIDVEALRLVLAAVKAAL